MTTECPFFQPSRSLARDLSAVGIYQDLVAVGVYCRLPNGRVHVPSTVDVKRFCVPEGCFVDCPVYQRHAAAAV
jgi:hypothetical protein